ncbi:hypothetical protein Tsubulata_017225 [Turnera subulata]|uniref:Uncharacterized protein n=1 Tax=Turnera subulata TaxID=218843 RepID=A0A9Q0JS80_9ROSI|nr:hypothetical protein Tsubulata_017225 [Turnera subulata]
MQKQHVGSSYEVDDGENYTMEEDAESSDSEEEAEGYIDDEGVGQDYMHVPYLSNNEEDDLSCYRTAALSPNPPVVADPDVAKEPAPQEAPENTAGPEEVPQNNTKNVVNENNEDDDVSYQEISEQAEVGGEDEVDGGEGDCGEGDVNQGDGVQVDGGQADGNQKLATHYIKSRGRSALDMRPRDIKEAAINDFGVTIKESMGRSVRIKIKEIFYGDLTHEFEGSIVGCNRSWWQ